MDYLVHYGVKGMKWGKRKAAIDAITDANETIRESTENGYANSSDRELKALARRNAGRSGYSLNELKKYRVDDQKRVAKAQRTIRSAQAYLRKTSISSKSAKKQSSIGKRIMSRLFKR